MCAVTRARARAQGAGSREDYGQRVARGHAHAWCFSSKTCRSSWTTRTSTYTETFWSKWYKCTLYWKNDRLRTEFTKITSYHIVTVWQGVRSRHLPRAGGAPPHGGRAVECRCRLRTPCRTMAVRYSVIFVYFTRRQSFLRIRGEFAPFRPKRPYISMYIYHIICAVHDKHKLIAKLKYYSVRNICMYHHIMVLYIYTFSHGCMISISAVL